MEASVVQDMDTVMQSSEVATTNGHSNGYLDPRVLQQLELEMPASTDSRGNSPGSSTRLDVALPRRAYLPTGCCYDPRMKFHANADFSNNTHHPEDPRRIESIMNEFRGAGLIHTGFVEDLEQILEGSPTQYMFRIDARKATESEICTVHSAAHYDWVHSLSRMSSTDLRQLTTTFDVGRKSLYVGNLTYEAALISAGGAIETCKAVVAGQVKNAVAVIRPPGHHAEQDESLGFCIFNNVPIAAKVCMKDFPEICRKILILDWDVHHGNGIQNMFYTDPNVLYISLHVYQNGVFYPGPSDDPKVPDGGMENCGNGKGVGRNINIGWTDQGVGDAEYMVAFQSIIMPIASEFDPDLVIVSAGFDAAAGDELGGCFVSPACYSHMTHMLMSLANGKVAVCLEGGYNLRAISRSALAVAKTLMGEPPERIVVPPLNRTSADTLNLVKRIQATYWDCMRPGVIPAVDINSRSVVKLSDVIRTFQANKLAETHSMAPITILRNGLTKPFENQVLITPKWHKSKKLIMFIHGPPDVIAQPDLYDNTIYPHNAYVSDELKSYIDWAIKEGFGVMDINFPQQMSKPRDQHNRTLDAYDEKLSESALNEQTKSLLVYIWENYIELLGPGVSITLVGIGDANLGIKQLLTTIDGSRKKVPCVLSFIDMSLRTVRAETDPQLSPWYRDHSLIFIVPDHVCFTDPDQNRKVAKSRFGQVRRADIEVGNGGNPISKMLARHQLEARTWIMEKLGEWETANYFPDPDETEDEAEGLGVTMGGDTGGDTEMEMGGGGEIVSSRMPIVGGA